MYYGGSANVPGAPGNPGYFPSTGYSPQFNPFIAGNPSFDINPNRQPTQPGVGPQAPNMYMPTQILDPRMRQQRMEQSVPTTAVRLAGLMPGMTPMGNAGFYAGPQLGQQVPGGMVKAAIY
jgi:hypothetical protein